jgi:hypothetical protein
MADAKNMLVFRSISDKRNGGYQNSFFKDCTNCENHMTDQELIDTLAISDTDMQAITDHLTADVGFDIEQILAGLDFDVAQILGSHALFGNRPA